MAQRVDFKHVRQHGSFEAVLASYDIELIKDGTKPGQYKALCPFHDDTKPSLKCNVERNIFNCYPCGASGNILDFVKEKDGCDLRLAAFKVAEISGIAPDPRGGSGSPKPNKKSKTAKKKAKPSKSSSALAYGGNTSR